MSITFYLSAPTIGADNFNRHRFMDFQEYLEKLIHRVKLDMVEPSK